MHGNRAAISHSDGLTSGGKGFEPSGPNEENYAHETAPFDRYGIPFGNKEPMRLLEGPTVRIRLPPADSLALSGFRVRSWKSPGFPPVCGLFTGTWSAETHRARQHRAEGRYCLCWAIFQYRSAMDAVRDSGCTGPKRRSGCIGSHRLP